MYPFHRSTAVLFGLFRRSKPRLHVFEFPGRSGPEFRDPTVCRRKLIEVCPDWGELADLVYKSTKPLPANMAGQFEEQRNELAEDALHQLAVAVGVAFDLPDVQPNGTGYSEAERIEVLGLYLGYCRDVMERTLPLAGTRLPTASATA